MRNQFPVSSGTSLNLNYPLILKCARDGCNEKAFELYKLNPNHTMMIEDQAGFLELIGASEPQKCVYLEMNERKENFAMQEEPVYSKIDGNAYCLLSCRCGNVFGAHIYSGCYDDKRFIGMFWLIPSSLIVQQGYNQQPLMMVMNAKEDSTKNTQQNSQVTSAEKMRKIKIYIYIYLK